MLHCHSSGGGDVRRIPALAAAIRARLRLWPYVTLVLQINKYLLSLVSLSLEMRTGVLLELTQQILHIATRPSFLATII
jgi:hypothetical protein